MIANLYISTKLLWTFLVFCSQLCTKGTILKEYKKLWEVLACTPSMRWADKGVLLHITVNALTGRGLRSGAGPRNGFFYGWWCWDSRRAKGKGRNTWQAPVLASVSQSLEGVGEEVECASRLCERCAHWDSQTLECLEADQFFRAAALKLFFLSALQGPKEAGL